MSLTQASTRRDRIAVRVAPGLGGGGRRRGSDRAELDGAARISVHRLRRTSVNFGSGQHVHVRSGSAGAARRPELSVRPRCPAAERHPRCRRDANWTRTMSTCTVRPRSSGRAIRPFRSPYRAPTVSPWRRRPRDHRYHTVCRHAAVARRGAVGQPRDRPGLRSRRYPRRAGFPSGESYKLGFLYPYARVHALFHPPDHRSRRRTEKVDADINQFEQSTTKNRLVLTAASSTSSTYSTPTNTPTIRKPTF